MEPTLTAEAAAQLQEGIHLVFSRWAALRMVVENEWGGRDSLNKSHQLELSIFQRLTQTKEQVYIDDIEDMLDDFMLSLNTEIGDGSIEEELSPEKLMFMREECLEGNFDSIKTLRESNVPTVSYNRQSGSNDHDDSDDDDKDDNNLVGENPMEMDVDDDPQLQSNHTQKGTVNPEPSVPKLDDGWTVVASKRNRGLPESTSRSNSS
ncbi:Pre-rRNA-processing protein TSR2- conserved region [Striga hermonthica]|uniref:Pre-rRNA-processing protein TSR2- conserved region n=1 Tax=Striga hermonthica TaxID=68872 RepID=A0A9N7MUA8_STRHE|nr:Pre-rRNA-processing protein TSR2- conserved region [Striga hermonthica]